MDTEKHGKVRTVRVEESNAFPGHFEIYLPGNAESSVTVWEMEGVDAKALAEKITAAIGKGK